MIHKAYNKWVNILHSEIKTALSFTKQGKSTHESKIDVVLSSTRKGKSTHETKCKFSKSRCFKKARTQCNGPYKVLSSDRYWGGIFADILPGPVRWYTMAYECGQSSEQKLQQAEITANTLNEVSLVSVGGVYEIPVTLNDVLKINVIIDSGASEVHISPDVASTLFKTGTIVESDLLEDKIYQLADGSTAKNKRFKLKSVTIGNRTFRNVTCSIASSVESPMLLGQSLLKQLGKYTIDYKKGVMRFE